MNADYRRPFTPFSPHLLLTAANANYPVRDRISLWPWGMRRKALEEAARMELDTAEVVRLEPQRSIHIPARSAGAPPATVADIMTREVVSVLPDTPIHEIANTLLEKRIRAVPVTDSKGRLLGVVSEADLIRRVELGTDEDGSWWRKVFRDASTAAVDYVRSHGRRARHVMTARPVTTTADTPLHELARALGKRRLRWLPAVAGDHVIGVVSRSDLVRALARLSVPRDPGPRSDEAVRKDLEARIGGILSGPKLISVTVHKGDVNLWGLVSSGEERAALHVAAENTPGVRAVNDQMFTRPSSMS
ncbi:CBS domain-containing protein [Microvirga massiliensis]|uniref:CBS domain-containing protein n=1 Tax=Microvirga massiliensis TaxID=1033741 RepID=UPI00164CF209|nr:CBS domain-containing protein [Microvirga massiliensis]